MRFSGLERERWIRKAGGRLAEMTGARKRCELTALPWVIGWGRWKGECDGQAGIDLWDATAAGG